MLKIPYPTIFKQRLHKIIKRISSIKSVEDTINFIYNLIKKSFSTQMSILIALMNVEERKELISRYKEIYNNI